MFLMHTPVLHVKKKKGKTANILFENTERKQKSTAKKKKKTINQTKTNLEIGT